MNKQEMLKYIDETIMLIWNMKEIDNVTKWIIVKKLEEIQMILQGEITE